MLARLFTAVTLLSLLTCAAAASLWIRSHWVADYVARHAGDEDAAVAAFHDSELASIHGALALTDRLGTRGVHSIGDPPDDPKPARYEWGRASPRPEYPTVQLTSLPDFPGINGRTAEFHAAGFALAMRDQASDPFGFRERNCVIIVPMPAMVLLTALLPAAWAYRQWNRGRRKRFGAVRPCPNCGYSLIGNTSGVCPECGTQIAERR